MDYNIKQGSHYSRGYRKQPILISILLFMAGCAWLFFYDLPNRIAPLISIILVSISIVTYIREKRSSDFIRKIVEFKEGCLYQLEGEDEFDINKLFGVGFGDHRRCSGRFGWNSVDGKLNVYAYVRNRGVMQWAHIMSCSPNESLDMFLKTGNGYYEFSILRSGGERWQVKLGRESYWLHDLLPYRLYPYFGGTSKAPHDMTIHMKDVN